MPAAPTPSTHLFVYGTLRRSDEFPTHELMFPATFVSLGTFPGRLYDLGLYPGAILSAEAGALVHGEIYLLHDPAGTLGRLDAYEGCAADQPTPHEYVRRAVTITTASGEILQAETYLYKFPAAHLTPVASGDYLRWRAQRSAPASVPLGAA